MHHVYDRASYAVGKAIVLSERSLGRSIVAASARFTYRPQIGRRYRQALGQQHSARRHLSGTAKPSSRQVYVALGSNVGDSVANIEAACRQIDAHPAMRIVDTSCLYRTQPMYVEDQPPFINGACELETSLAPTQLLDQLQAVENRLGRIKLIDKGPRNIDLDIIGHGQNTVSTKRLTIPHALLHERTFVLRPLCDLRSGPEWRLPSSSRTAQEHLDQLDDDLQPFTAFGNQFLHPLQATRRTRLMSILNITPDSFSDSGRYYKSSEQALQKAVARHVAAGADVIDIGGQSSRPHAADISAEEEIERILPAIRAIRSLPQGKDVNISVDTYRANVAEAAVDAGANIINDISAGLLDSAMLATVARLGCTYIMMHMRGTPSSMSSEQNCSYPDGVNAGVARELDQRLSAALEAGIRRWRIVLDPGLGFAKNVQGNLHLLRHFDLLRQHRTLRGIPWLVGSSKKRFIGIVTGTDDAAERNWGTAATVTAAIAGGADVIRVHDVEPMLRVIKMTDAIYR